MDARLHRTAIGRTREVRGPDALELVVARVIVAVVVVIAAGFGSRLKLMAQTLDALSLAWAQQVNLRVYFAEHGRWPSAGDSNVLGDARKGSHVEDLTLAEGGVITAQVSLGQSLPVGKRDGASATGGVQGRLSFRPELMGSAEEPAISFLCGYALSAAGTVETDAVNRTTLPEKYLPPFCR
jgi:hypothetical protein